MFRWQLPLIALGLFSAVPFMEAGTPAKSAAKSSKVLRSRALAATGADEFQGLTQALGNVAVIAGIHLATTTNPDGSAINEWTADSEGAIAKNTALSNPHVAAADALGNIYIADKASHAILKVTPDGRIHTFAGTHVTGFNGDGPALATALQIASPNGIYVFPDGTVYLLDPGNHRIRRVGTDGIMTTVVNDPDPNWYPSGRALWVRSDEKLIYYTNEYAPATVGGPAQGACIKAWTKEAGIALLCDRSVGFYNPGNLDVNPADGKLYVCDRAEDDTSKTATGLWRIDGIDLRTRITGSANDPIAASDQPALTSNIQEIRGIAFLSNGAYFTCGHKDGSIWYVDTQGSLHLYIRGLGKKDAFSLSDGLHPPLAGTTYIAQPRAVTLAPDGSLLVVCNDSGFVFKVKNVAPPQLPVDLRVEQHTGDGTVLGWSSLPGHSYVIEKAFSLNPSNWNIIGAKNAAASSMTFFDSAAPASSAAFYRLSPPR